ncbi:hypothetical protein HC928_23150, partial [bacterium]|nr:hypothetical protein [bacterium]
ASSMTPTTLSLAATVTGLDGHTAMQMLAPSADELSKRKAAPQQKARPAGLQGVIAYVVMIAAAVVLAGYFLFPWFDISATPATDVAGSPARWPPPGTSRWASSWRRSIVSRMPAAR